MPATPTYFIDCDKLKPEPHVDRIRFQQFFMLHRKSPAGHDMPALHPGRYTRRNPSTTSMDAKVAVAVLNAAAKVNRLEAVNPAMVQAIWKTILGGTKPGDPPPIDPPDNSRPDASGRDLLDIDDFMNRPDVRRAGRLTIGDPPATHETMAMAAANPSFVSANYSLAGTLVRRTGSNVIDVALGLLNSLDLTPLNAGQDSPNDAVWALGVRYVQSWASQGYVRGRLLRSVALPAGASSEIVIKSWTKKTERREEVESVDQDISTEIVGDESWSLAVTKAVSNTLNTGVEGNLKGNADVSVPMKGAQVGAGGEAGVGGNVDNTLETSWSETEEQIKKTTRTQADRLKKSKSSTVEIAGESGFETTATTKIENPNRCHTLNYHFFGVTERMQVTTATEEVHPYLLVPLPVPDVTKAWLLCHECALKPLLPCETYYAGFDAAKIMIARQKLGLPTGNMSDEQVSNAVAGLETEIQAALTAFNLLANARIDMIGDAGGDEGGMTSVLDTAGNVVNDGLNAAGDAAGAAYDAMVGLYEGASDLASQGVAAAGSFFGLAQTAAPQPGMAMQRSIDPGGGGPGSWLWWQVAGEVAPELARAYETLQGRFSAAQAVSDPAARNRAMIETATAFFADLGDVDMVFRKVNIAVMVVVSAAIYGTVIAAAYVLAAGAVLGVIVAAAVGLGAIAALAAPIMATPDFAADDEGLETAVNMLKGRFEHARNTALMPPAPPKDAGEETMLAYQQAIAEAQRQQMQLALQEVEYERLVCHINDHLLTYMQTIWSEMSASEIRERLLALNIEPFLFELRFDGFVGHRGALRLSDIQGLADLGFDWSKQREALKLEDFYKKTRDPFDVDMPTEGVVAEAALGECDGCDEFVKKHRDLDLADKAEEVRARTLANQTRDLENKRLQARLDASEFDDPKPYGSIDELNVHLHNPDDDDD